MKATIEIPDELYRLVKAKSALEGRAVREVTVELYQHYVEQSEAPESSAHEAAPTGASTKGQTIPTWFGVLGKTARAVTRHDMSAIRESIARGIARDRDL
ncbi:MAG TPA: hypothetical protein VIA62_08340 [Thermoanaerobaculia bacterium]|jgi:hypothetical protein|nr:hypothetical protein [Thermoanaerobaculia bacterium]